MDKLKMHSMDGVAANIEKIGALFPNCVTETMKDGKIVRAIDFDMLRQELSDVVVEGPTERYQFTWPEKRKSVLTANTPISATLRPFREESEYFETTENLYIEGDNLEVLKVLQETYLGRIKLIYIDPPYNTGSDSFVYNDNYTMSLSSFEDANGTRDESGNIVYDIRTNSDSNGRFHTDWLNMMYPRLRLAKNLLTSDGIIMISIDNNEIANMKRICDEIFGGDAFVTIIHVQMSTAQGQKVRAAKAGNIVKNGEHILVYSRDGNKAIGTRPLLDPVKYDNHYNKFLVPEEDGTYSEESLTDVVQRQATVMAELRALGMTDRNGNLSATSIQGYYEHSPLFREFINNNAEKVVRVHDSVDVPSKMKDSMVVGVVYKYSTDNRSYLVSRGNDGSIKQRIQLSDKLSYADDFYRTFGPTTIRGDWWPGYYLDMGNVSKEGGVSYDNGKKPVRLIRHLIEFCTNDDDIILDFFSGSATTAHAAMQLAADSGTSRHFIMIQLDEDLDHSAENAAGESKKAIKETIKFLDSIGRPHILSEIGKERIRRAGRQIKESSPLTLANLDIGFRVLKLDSSNMKDVYYNPEEYTMGSLFGMADNIKEDRTPEDLLFQVMLDLGILLSSKIEETTIAGKKVFSVADGYLYACFDSDVSEETVKAIAQKKPYYAVFRDSGFATDSVATNFEQIFETYSPSTTRKVL